MNKAVIYFGATGNEAADQMVMQVLEEYCAVNGYEVVAVISENARPEGMTFPMKFAFVGMAEVEDVDVVVTLMSDMVGDCEETIMDNIIMLGEHGITVETANDDMAGYYQKMEQAGKKEEMADITGFYGCDHLICHAEYRSVSKSCHNLCSTVDSGKCSILFVTAKL